MNPKMQQVLDLLTELPPEEQVPLTWTSRGNVLTSRLKRHVYWRDDDTQVSVLEEYRLDSPTGPMVRNGMDVKLKKGESLLAEQAQL